MSWLWEAAKQAASGDVSGAASTATSGAQQTYEDAKDAAQDAYDAATDAAQDAYDTATDAVDTAKDTATEATETAQAAGTAFLGKVIGNGTALGQSTYEQGTDAMAAMGQAADHATGGKLSQGFDSATAAAEAASTGDIKGAAQHGGEAAGAFGEATVNVGRAAFDHTDHATGGKLSESLDHANDAIGHLGRGDYEAAVESGKAAAGSLAQAPVVASRQMVEKADEMSGGKLSDLVEQGYDLLHQGIEHAGEQGLAAYDGYTGYLRDTRETIRAAGTAAGDQLDDWSGGKLGEAAGQLGAAGEAAIRGDLDTAARQGAQAKADLQQAGANIVGTAIDAADDASGGKLGEVAQKSVEAGQRALEGDYEGALGAAGEALENSSAAFENLAQTGLDAADDATGGKLSDARDTVREGIADARELLDEGIEAANEGFDAVTGGKVAEGQASTQAAAAAAMRGDLDTAAREGAKAAAAYRDAAKNVVQTAYDAADDAAGGKLTESRDHLDEAARNATEGDFEGAARAGLDAANSSRDAVRELAGTGYEMADGATGGALTQAEQAIRDGVDRGMDVLEEHVDTAMEMTDTYTGGLLSETREELLAAAEAIRNGQVDNAASHASAAMVASTEVAAQLATGAAKTLDDYSDGRLAEAHDALEQFADDMEARRYDDALADLDRAADAYAEAPTAIGPAGGFRNDPIDRIRETAAKGGGHEAVYADLGRVVDDALHPGDGYRRDEPSRRDLEKSGRPDHNDPMDSLDRPPATRVDEPIVETLTNGHLGGAARYVREAAEADRDGRREEAEAAAENAKARADDAGPAAAGHLVAVADAASGGYLGTTYAAIREIRQSAQAEDYEQAAASAEQAEARYAEMATVASEEVAPDMQHDEPPADREAGYDLTDGHAAQALDAAEKAVEMRDRGNEEAARHYAEQAGDEYEAAVAQIDRSVDTAVHEMVARDAPPPAHDAAAAALDRACGGNLREARQQLDEGCRSARSDDLPRAVECGRQAGEYMRNAQQTMEEQAFEGPLAREIETMRDEYAAPTDGAGEGPMEDPADEREAEREAEPAEPADDLGFGTGAREPEIAPADERPAYEESPTVDEPMTPAAADERPTYEEPPTIDEPMTPAAADERPPYEESPTVDEPMTPAAAAPGDAYDEPMTIGDPTG